MSDKPARETLTKLRQFLPEPNDESALKQVAESLVELVENGFLAEDGANSKFYITEKGKKWQEEMEIRFASGIPKAHATVPTPVSDIATMPATAPLPSSENAEALRQSFKVPSIEQVKSVCKRLYKVNKYGNKVMDKDAFALLRTYVFKMKLAQKLEQDIKKTSPD